MIHFKFFFTYCTLLSLLSWKIMNYNALKNVKTSITELTAQKIKVKYYDICIYSKLQSSSVTHRWTHSDTLHSSSMCGVWSAVIYQWWASMYDNIIKTNLLTNIDTIYWGRSFHIGGENHEIKWKHDILSDFWWTTLARHAIKLII